MSISTFAGIETTLRGLLAQQQALDITGHNISNANTVGYTREQASLQATRALTVGPGLQLGTGVDVVGFQRIRDSFIDVQLRAQTMVLGAAQSKQDGLSQVEGILNEPSDNGLSALLNKYWSAWQDLSNSPEDPATRQSLVEAAQSLTDGFNGLSTQLTTIGSQTSQNAALTLQEINADAQTLQGLNTATYDAVANRATPNDLYDQRDVILDKLGQLGNVAITDLGDGTQKVVFDGVTLVDGKIARTLTESGGTLTNDAVPPETGTVGATTGKLGGLIDLRDNAIPGYQSQLDLVASTLIKQTNAILAGGVDVNGVTQPGGYALDGTTGNPFFSGTSASNIAVVATAAKIGAAAAAGKPGDNTIALQVGALRTNVTLAPLGGSTIDGAYAKLVTTIGSDSAEATRAANNAQVLSDSLSNRRDSISSVSTDEEMANLVRFQRAYAASARALTAMDDALDLLISRTGRAGL